MESKLLTLYSDVTAVPVNWLYAHTSAVFAHSRAGENQASNYRSARHMGESRFSRQRLLPWGNQHHF